MAFFWEEELRFEKFYVESCSKLNNPAGIKKRSTLNLKQKVFIPAFYFQVQLLFQTQGHIPYLIE